MVQSIQCVFTADLHGNIEQYEKLLSFIRQNEIDLVFLGGDLFPKEGGLWHLGHKTRTISSQAKFINQYFIPFIVKLTKTSQGFFIMGNDDFKSNESLLKDISDGFQLIHTESRQINHYYSVVGYPYVSLSPFLNKDWEKWDTSSSRSRKSLLTHGYFSLGKQHLKIDFMDKKHRVDTIERDLEKIVKLSDPKKTVYLFHDAPYGTNLDLTFADNPYIKPGNRNIGSKAIRQFIEKYQPLLTLHGHIHETVDQSGSFIEKIGDSLSFACGNDNNSRRLALIVYDLHNLESASRIVV